MTLDKTKTFTSYIYKRWLRLFPAMLIASILIYSTVKGKVTSSGKRLTPTTVANHGGNGSQFWGEKVHIGDNSRRTGEVLQDDGTYGSSIKYLFWWDSQGRYHQHYVSGGQILHISDQPLAVKSITINMEVTPSSFSDDTQ